jgi:hypothetical protein
LAGGESRSEERRHILELIQADVEVPPELGEHALIRRPKKQRQPHRTWPADQSHRDVVGLAVLSMESTVGLVARVRELWRRSRQRSRFKTEHKRMLRIVRLGSSGRTSGHPYRTGPEQVTGLPPSWSWLAQEGDRALLVRYLMVVPRRYASNAAHRGAALVGQRGTEHRLIANLHSPRPERRLEPLLAVLEAFVVETLGTRLVSESWCWERGDADSLQVE